MLEKIDFVFKTKPMEHQKKAFEASRDKQNFALLMEQGTGKTKVTIDTIAWLYAQGKINAAVIIAPNGVHKNWLAPEFPIHFPDYIPYKSIVLQPSNASKKYLSEFTDVFNYKELKVFVINVEAFVSDKAQKLLENILISHHCILVLDESSRIKSSKAKITKTLCKLSKHARYRRILTGTPVTQGPQDLYPQFKFLDPNILGDVGYSSFVAYKNHFVITEQTVTLQGQRYEKILGYNNLDELNNILSEHSFRVLKEECLDLPEKIYKRVFVEMGKEQEKAYQDFKEEMMTLIGEQVVTAPIVLTQMLRGQQILGGFLPLPNGGIHAFSPNPKLEMLLTLCEDLQGKVIIWANFQQELAAITYALKEEFGPFSTVSYYGETSKEDRQRAVHDFQNNKDVIYFVANPKMAGIGLTLTAASNVIYYSNNFSLEVRLQSEDRPHRIGQRNNVLYVDLEIPKTIDTTTINALKSKKNVADVITGDEVKNWL